ncbi:alpha/beta hydrolase [Sphingomonas piscis]|uniref:Alpha/beta hydrolase n=1 Tax=Sphingomonas piscis TaxID=2714943 RepID=A0A6G7YM11_9SPHN|nr:alpha/beta hydrolase [Sphingomonas piscis]QIK77779.1 alpha/beta hydrolase [Sphingomonas piscis]
MTLLASTAVSAQQWGDPPLPAGKDPETPSWPPRERLALWPGRPPGGPAQPIALDWTMNGPTGGRQLWVRGVETPEINVFRAPEPDGSAVLVIPGGGYDFVSVQSEGLEIADFLNTKGTTAFVLTYRLPGEGWTPCHLAPLQDAQRAMRLIRAKASTFGIDPERLGVLGFSAGGHLAADLTVSHGQRVHDAVDAVDSLSARPAFSGLIYPVATVQPGASHGGSRDKLLGPNPSQPLADARSPLRHITGETAPTFLVHAIDDDLVPVANTIDWLAACRAAEVPCEAHLYSEGGHGFALRAPKDSSASQWGEMFARWMRKHGG